MKYVFLIIGLTLSTICYAPKGLIEPPVERPRDYDDQYSHFPDELTGRQRAFCTALLVTCVAATTIAAWNEPKPATIVLQFGSLGVGGYALGRAAFSGATSSLRRLGVIS